MGAPSTLALSPDGTTLAWVENSSVVFIQGLVGTPAPVGPLDPNDADGRQVTHLVFSADSRTLESSGGDAVLWDSTTGARLATVPVPSDWSVIAASPDQRLLALFNASISGEIKFEDAASGRPVGSAIHGVSSWLGGALPSGAFSTDGARFVVANGAPFVAAGGSRGVWVVEPVPLSPALATELPVNTNGMAAISDDTTRAIVADHATGRVILVDARSGVTIATLQESGEKVNGVGVSADGSAAAWVTTSGTVSVWNAARGVAHTLPTRCQFLDCVLFKFSPDGRVVAPVPTRPGSPVLWDTTTGAAMPTQPAAGGTVSDLAFAPSGRTIALKTDFGLAIWDGAALRLVGTLSASPTGGVHFSRDGTTLVTVDSDIKVWSTRDWTLLRSFRAPETLTGFSALSPDGRTLATSEILAVRLWDLDTGEPLPTALIAPRGAVLGLTFRADGDLYGAEGFPYDLGGDAAGVIHWRIGLDALRNEACQIANRDMTRLEWTRAVGDALRYDPPCAAVLAKAAG